MIALRPAPFETPAEAATEGTLKVLEIYLASGQGEGIWTGTPSTFIRLAGCTVGCGYCDTKYSWRASQGQAYDPYTLARAAHTNSRLWRDIVLTGGEPLEQSHALVHDLLKYLTALDHAVTIETSGAFMPLPSFDWNFMRNTPMRRILWSVAPKLSFAGARFQTTAGALSRWVSFAASTQAFLQFKWVCRNTSDIDEMLGHMEQMHSGGLPLICIVQPCTEVSERDEENMKADLLRRTAYMQDYVMKNERAIALSGRGIQVFVRPQLHVLLYGSRRLV